MTGHIPAPPPSDSELREKAHIESWLKDEGFLPIWALSRKKMAEIVFVYCKYERGIFLRDFPQS